ncbi:hypothetical protein E6C27_scaffold65G00490 [Cucumis melo var. makuwa]|uniref:Uncharacterized protein n=2 Tax=Cucumis melo TaxID=3656 RepID=A0A5A7SUD3_CUCMM|nr:hypothetical protein E6C27_scaffold65G00490 [Cucumis melo var. makuwa]
MAQIFYSPHQPTGAGSDEAASRNHGSRKKSKQPISHSPDFNSLHSTTRSTVCKFSASQTDLIAREFAHSLIAWVVGKEIRPLRLARHLHRHLRLTELPDVFELGLGYFVLKFCETDFLALEDNPWPIPNLCIYAFPWTPNFKPSEAMDSAIDCWIRLKELPIEYYKEDILRDIGKTVGEALVKIDPITKDRKKCKYARICVRINVYEPLPSSIRIGKILQEIEYEGFDVLCPRCECVVHLKHDCLNSSGSSSSFEPDHPRNGSNSKQPLVPSESSVAWGSRFEVPGTESKSPLQNLKALSIPSMGGSEKAATRTSSSPLLPQSSGLLNEPLEKQKEKCGGSFEIFPNLPKEDLPQSLSISSNLEESSSSTISVPVFEQKNLNLSMVLAPLPAENPFTPAETSCSIKLEVHNNQPQPSSSPLAASISTQPSSPSSKTIPTFCSSGIARSILKKKITSASSQGFGINRRPILYTIPESIKSFEVGLSENPDSAPKQNQFSISFVSTPRSGTKAISALDSKKMLGWNFRGMDNVNLIEGLNYMVQKYEPSIVVIFGTRITDDVVEEVVDKLAFPGSYIKKFDNYHGGVWLFMFREDVQTEVFEVNSYSTQQVSASTYFQLEINEPMARRSYPDMIRTSLQTWGLDSFCDSTYSRGNALAY